MYGHIHPGQRLHTTSLWSTVLSLGNCGGPRFFFVHYPLDDTYLSKVVFVEAAAIRVWRLICMGFTAVMLAIALGSTGCFDYSDKWPEICVLTYNFVNLENEIDKWLFRDYEYINLSMVIVLCFLSSSYLSRVVHLFPSIQPIMRSFFRSWPSKAIQKVLLLLRDRATVSPSKYMSKLWLWRIGFYCLNIVSRRLWRTYMNQ